jgi:hypothetical protein
VSSRTTKVTAHPIGFAAEGVFTLFCSALFVYLGGVCLWAASTAWALSGFTDTSVFIVVIGGSPILLWLFVFIPIDFFAAGMTLLILSRQSRRASDPAAPVAAMKVFGFGRFARTLLYPLTRTRWSDYWAAVRETSGPPMPWRLWVAAELVWIAVVGGILAAHIEPLPVVCGGAAVLCGAAALFVLANRKRTGTWLRPGKRPFREVPPQTAAHLKADELAHTRAVERAAERIPGMPPAELRAAVIETARFKRKKRTPARPE